MTRSPLIFLKLWLLTTRWHNSFLNRSCFHIFHVVNRFDPYDPYMTFEVKVLITLVATNPLVILTKLHDYAT